METETVSLGMKCSKIYREWIRDRSKRFEIGVFGVLENEKWFLTWFLCLALRSCKMRKFKYAKIWLSTDF
jgi:hypothetical protein